MLGSSGWILTLAIVISLANANYPPPQRLTGMNPCISKQTCHECIQTPHCAWCAAPKFSEKRCFLPNINTKIFATCPAEYTWNPDNVFSMMKHRNLTKGGYSSSGTSSYEYSYSNSSSFSSSSQSTKESSSSSSSKRQEAVQIWPQEVNLKLRINEAYRMNFAYSQAEDYPVDLYYLMDLSKSMEDDKKKLSDLGQLLVESMSKITSNFRLGFGSFVDKVVMPYVNTMPKSLIEPCDGCAAPYGYKNIMTLSQDTSHFASLVRNASVSGNLDAPEGGFDAIMQAIVCRRQIGWREKARRLLVFSTDAGFHYAGDGKLGGIIKPNDGECHLDGTGLYTHSSLQDYPSISQINLKVKQNAINVIWAVTEEQINIYKRLTNHVEGSFAGKLSDDSSNDCSGRGTCACGQCECEERENPKEIISGHFCECDNFSCDRDQGVLCSDHGTCECGQCVCHGGWSGPSCNCKSSNETCIPRGTKSGILCSGHGDCVCGECICHEEGNIRYSGKFCNNCPTCPSRCEELKNCVLCQMYGTGNFSDKEECAKNCKEFVPEPVEIVIQDVDKNEELCFGIDEDDCKYNFVSYYDETNCLKVRAQKERECPPQVYMLGIVLGVIAAIVLIGLALLLLWKLLTTIHDRREFAKFEKDRMMAKWDTGENPIYKQATSTFKNPTYAGK
nr:integrin beta-PS-like [Nomia melanderi]